MSADFLDTNIFIYTLDEATTARAASRENWFTAR